MTYIILAAGKGSNLHPLTLKYPKTSFRLDENTTVLQRMVRTIRRHDKDAEIVVVIGHHADMVKKELDEENCRFVLNPFYEVTNSISSLWFARQYLERENVTIVHGDVVYDDDIIETHLVKQTNHPYVLTDSLSTEVGSYNVVVKDSQVMVMSKKLENSTARYCCMAKLDAVSARLMKEEVDIMIKNNMYDQYFEDSLVQLVMFKDFQLFSADIAGRKWSEVDTVDDLLVARQIHHSQS